MKNKLHILKTILAIAFLAWLLWSLTACAPGQTALIMRQPEVTFIESTGMNITADGRFLLVQIPDNHRLHRGTWVFEMDTVVEVDTMTVWEMERRDQP